MTTKKRHDTMRKAKPMRLTARKGRTYGVSVIDTIAKRAKRTTLRDVVKAARDNGMDVKIDLKPNAVEQPHKFEIRNGFVVNSTATPEQAEKIAAAVARHARDWRQFESYSMFFDKPASDAFEEGVRAHEEAEAAPKVLYVDPRKDPSPEDLMINVRYGTLRDVFNRAFDQAARGKGSERHGRGLTFEEQPTQVISDLLDSDAGLAFQAIKKVNEGMRLEHEPKIKEMLGAINYIASIVIRMERNKK